MKVHSSKQFPEKEEMELSIQKLDKDLKEAYQARDKVLQELTRLKQHLLDKVDCPQLSEYLQAKNISYSLFFHFCF